MKSIILRYFIGLILMSLSFPSLITGQEMDYFPVEFIMDQERFNMPYFGGFDNAQLSNIDLNRDGVMDIVVYDRQGEIIIPFVWENGEWIFSPEYRKIFPEDILNWLLLIDFDKDGVTDIFTSKYVSGSGIRVFKGRYDSDWSFDEHLFYDPEDNSLTNELIYANFSGQMRNLEVPTADVPCFADVDFDGDLDILAFQELGNNIYFYRNTSLERGHGTDSLLFQLDKKCWGGVAEAFLGSELFLADEPGECGEEGLVNNSDSIATATVHASSTLAAFDMERDQDLDIFIGDADLDSLSFLTNQKVDGVDWFVAQTKEFPSSDEPIYLPSFVVPFFLDVNNDGRKDMVNAANQFINAENYVPIRSYLQDVNGEFYKTDDNWISEIVMDFGSNSTPVFHDIDQDGLIDLLIGNFAIQTESGRIAGLHYFKNTGTRSNPEFTLEDDNWLGIKDLEEPIFNLKPCFGDLDNDGDADLLIGTNEGRLIYVENLAGAENAFAGGNIETNYMDIQVSLNAAPQIIDLNNDQLPDLVVGNELGFLNYFENIGSTNEAIFDSEHEAGNNTPRLGNVRVTDSENQFNARSTPHFLNTTDGLQCFIGNISGNIRVFTNVNTNGEDWVEISSPLNNVYEGKNSFFSLADIGGNEDLELVMGTQGGGGGCFGSDLRRGSSEFIGSNEEINIHITPNPVVDVLRFETANLPIASDLNVEIFNSQGARIENLTIYPELSLDIRHYSKGVYYCKFYKDGQFIMSKRFVYLGN